MAMAFAGQYYRHDGLRRAGMILITEARRAASAGVRQPLDGSAYERSNVLPRDIAPADTKGAWL